MAVSNVIWLMNCRSTDVKELIKNGKQEERNLTKWIVSLAEEILTEYTDKEKAKKIGMSYSSYRRWKTIIKKEKKE